MSSENKFNPFPGLRSFEEEEEYLFFGREKQIDELLNKLSHTRFLAVIGASGSGKSSLVKCGLLPSLHAGFLSAAGSGWRICTFKPGNDPIGNLSEALDSTEILGEKKEKEVSPSMIESILRRSDQGIGETLKQLSEPHKQNVLIVVDQFEELFRFTKYEKAEFKETRDSVTFINLLLAASKFKELPVYVVFTMRSDFLGDCTEFRGLPEAINDGQYLIPRMTREERKAAITGPIAVGVADISQALLTRLLNDVGDNPDQLPILQHALMRTWEYWQRNAKPNEPIELSHYEAIGTMARALSLHAEEAYSEVGSDKAKETCKKLFKSLTEKRDDGRGIRRPCQVKEICELAEVDTAEVVRIIELFRAPGRSLLMPPVGVDLKEDTVIDISHESLMRVWERLIIWVQEEIESAELYSRIAQSAALHQEGKTGLWRDPELQMAMNWKMSQRPNRVWAKRYDPSFDRAINFLDYSEAEKQKELNAAEKKRKAGIATLRVFISVIIIALCCVVYYAYNANRAKENADKAKIVSDSLRVQAELSAASDSVKTILANNLRIDAERERKKSDTLAVKASTASDSARKLMLAAIEDKKMADIQAAKIKDLYESEQEAAKEQKRLKEALQKTNDEVVLSKKEVENLRLLAEAKNIAIKSVQLINDPDLSLQLAFLAYGMNTDLNGPDQNRTIYDALKSQLNRAYMDSSRARLDMNFETGGYDIRSLVFINTNEFVTGGDEGVLKRWSISGNPLKINTLNKSASQAGQVNKFSSLAISPDKKIVIAGTTNGTIYSWDPFSNSFPVQLCKGNGKNNSIHFVPAAGNTYELILTFSAAVYAVSIDKTTLKASVPQKITVSNAASTNLSASACYSLNNKTNLFVSNGKTVYHLSGDNNAVFIQNSDSIRFDENISAIAVNSNGAFLAIGGSTGNIVVYKRSTNGYVEHKHVRGHLSSITRLLYSASDSILISGSMDHTIYVNNTEKKDEDNLVLKEKDTWIRDVAASPNNEYVVSVGQLGLIQVWPSNLDVVLKRVNKIKNYHKLLMGNPNEAKIKEEIGEQLFNDIYKFQKKTNFGDYWSALQDKYLK